ncbi:hypothetical protein SANT12839_002270 [Streptomyces antimycoticus]|uniref:Uncharacterized protein n=1 Tax=Streptomyces antimycoticus TaxID=68175 RepID=A0A4D4JRM8_9ACTN|nr:hypothetical protein SANT12839_002270 [Streptomyces antimycoticus]
MPQSGITVDPRITPPDSRTRAVMGASASGTTGSVPALPEGMGTPLRATFSFSVTGTPSMDPSGSPAAHRASLAWAALRDSSGSRTQNALSTLSRASMTDWTASWTWTGDNVRSANRATISTAGMVARPCSVSTRSLLLPQLPLGSASLAIPRTFEPLTRAVSVVTVPGK